MFSKKALVVLAVMALLSIIAAQCGGATQPQVQTVIETVVVTREVEGETVTVDAEGDEIVFR